MKRRLQAALWRRRRPRFPSVGALTADGQADAVALRWTDGVQIATDPSPANWIAPALLPWEPAGRVGSVVPTGFDAYARISHAVPPAAEDIDVEGSLPQPMAAALASILASDDAAQCWFAVWEGWGDIPPAPAVVHHPVGRNYVLLSGPLSTAASPLWSLNGSGHYQSPSLWWPSDRSWCVATEIDFSWTYVGASEDVVSRVLQDDRLPARRAEAGEAAG